MVIPMTSNDTIKTDFPLRYVSFDSTILLIHRLNLITYK
ncbi:hypothetical protein P278_31400 [Zhouia amylolytica AD3]|uniref:Uncharacterized protein n=1 Tax=Zhouia amylolytica AD3 TaxID=1286632 RepID=W2UJ37_9FLAO|nr:hypothetical protein P278_31400 [Zhouia amylolytica AD3]